MTISAIEPGRADEDRLERNLELYRDLSVALRDQITRIKQGGGDAACKDAVEAVKNHQKALQTVLDLEASLVKNTNPGLTGAEANSTSPPPAPKSLRDLPPGPGALIFRRSSTG